SDRILHSFNLSFVFSFRPSTCIEIQFIIKKIRVNLILDKNYGGYRILKYSICIAYYNELLR
ncbi:MAG TPA: hypothetical protein PLP33_27350, partial [Leptospiraceae bacterium]|nr:hypothetical protein [Leptospiraceae bacterium]